MTAASSSSSSSSWSYMLHSRHGLLVVTDFSHRDSSHRAWWKCRCDCGRTCERRGDVLTRQDGRQPSCGCIRAVKATKHGGRYSSTYQSWQAMKNRCGDPNNKSWRWYGGRGITICPEWKDDFAAFLRDVGERPKGMTLDRKDPELGYFKSNVRWATKLQQAANRRARARMLADMIEDAREYAAGEAAERVFLAGEGA